MSRKLKATIPGDFQQEVGCELGMRGMEGKRDRQHWALEMEQHWHADWSEKNADFLFDRKLCQVAKEFCLGSWRPCVGAMGTSNPLLRFL